MLLIVMGDSRPQTSQRSGFLRHAPPWHGHRDMDPYCDSLSLSDSYPGCTYPHQDYGYNWKPIGKRTGGLRRERKSSA
jgi:hypothetical protein